jgi:RHS repeat-associated protein
MHGHEVARVRGHEKSPVTLRAAVALGLALLAACGGPASPPASAPQTIRIALITDQTNNPGPSAGFYWIPPVVTTAAPFTSLDQTGTANGLAIRIDRIYSNGSTDPGPAATFTGAQVSLVTGSSSASFPGVTGPFYGANWSPGSTVASGQTYRVSVTALTPARVLGVADVQVVANATAAAGVDRTRFTPLIVGATLPIVFRLENNDSDGDTLTNWRDNCPLVKNIGQIDSDGDGRGDACQCVNVPSGTSCKTSSCKTGETCQSGVCTGGTATNNGGTCHTGNPCAAATETCNAGVCGGTAQLRTSGACLSGNPCKAGGETCNTSGVCSGGTNASSTTACTSGTACRTGETCNAGVCGGTGHETKQTSGSCSTGNPCKTGETCNASAVCSGGAAKTNGTACSDGNLCTPGDTCQAGVCTPGPSLTLDDGNACTTDVCTATGEVTHPLAPDFTPCSDGNACTLGESCQAGLCKQPSRAACGAGNNVTFYTSYEQGSTADITDGSHASFTPVTFLAAPGLFGQGMSAATSSEMLYLTTAAASLAKPGSASFWFKTNDGHLPVSLEMFDAYTQTNLFLVDNGTVGLGALIYYVKPGQTTTTVAGGMSGVPVASMAGDGRWHLFVVNWTPTAIGVSIDGAVPVVTATDWLAPGHVFGTVNGTSIYAGGSNYNGSGDEVLILNRTMTAQEIQWYWSQGPAAGGGANPNPAIAYFNGSGAASCNQWDDLQPCTTDACTAGGGVTHAAIAPGTSCSDQNVCNGVETCNASGQCVASAPAVDDGVACTVDTCSYAGGIVHTTITDDGGLCQSLPSVTPTVYGIAKNSAGVLKAIFDYTTAVTSISIGYGPDNRLYDANNAPIASPPEMPPQTFTSAAHAPFVATLSGASLTWMVAGHSVTAATSSRTLPTTPAGDGTLDVTLADGRKINLDTTPPVSPAPAQGPPLGAAYTGVISGQLAVSPSGGATYNVPIVVPPGIAGMAPNLALVYNSQGVNGIAGQGWALSGLSAISRCPRTRQQDGYGRPVMLDSLTASANADKLSDGICLDGEKLFEQPAGSGNYVAERLDFSTITRKSTGEFQVVSKAGETRTYGLRSADRVGMGSAVGIWLLDRVADAWGNYFDVHYNNDNGTADVSQPASFLASGIWPSAINYTGTLTSGTCNVQSPPASCFFTTVSLQYECRPDIRWTRMANLKVPQSQRLKSITTALGTYSLTYSDDPVSTPQGGVCPVGSGPSKVWTSQLTQLGYCAGATCMQPSVFNWQQPPPSQSGMNFKLPSFVGTGKGLKGTQFVDINGDGRADFVLARANGIQGTGSPQVATVLNTGTGWGAPLTGTGQAFPLYLSDQNDNPTPVQFADLDGDGKLDLIIADPTNVACTGQGATQECHSCPPGKTCQGMSSYPLAVWLNRFNLDGSGVWHFDSTYSQSLGFTSEPAVTDVDGDGLADLVQATSKNGVVSVVVQRNIFVNGVHTGWTKLTQSFNVTNPGGLDPVYQMRDVNRDGLPDLVQDDFVQYADGSVQANEVVLPNQGLHTSNGSQVIFGPPITRSAPSGGTHLDPTTLPQRFADLNGDGFYDLVAYGSQSTTPGYRAAVASGDGIGSGFGTDPGQQAYWNVLKAFSPPFDPSGPPLGTMLQDYGYSVVDLNGDGLADLVRNHWQRPAGSISPMPTGGTEVLLNTGTTWLAVDGLLGWTMGLTAGGAGVIPFGSPGDATAAAGSAFVDLDGDGLLDLVQEESGDSNLTAGVWLNTSQRPAITGFPNGLANPTTVTYVSTTSAAGASTYKDDDTITEPNTRLLAMPVTIVASVKAEDGTGTATATATNTTTYTYHSLRQDAYGRGPLGFHRIEVFEGGSQVRTVTTYGQAFPYTGLPVQVDQYQVVGSQSHLMRETTTQYCDAPNQSAGAPFGCGAAVAGPFPPATSVYVHASEIDESRYLKPETDDRADVAVTATSFEIDGAGNPSDTITSIVKVENSARESVYKEVQNTYGDPVAAKEGKPTQTLVVGGGGTANTLHTTTFEYSPVTAFGGASSSVTLTKKHVEPGAGWPTQLDTAYSYDRFGHVTTATSCASDFDSCTAGATNPLSRGATDPNDPSDPVHHPPFRTATVSYDPSLLPAPVSYGIGRFPTRTTNALGQPETTVYEPVLGQVLSKTGPNGLQTCYQYDALGRQKSAAERCNTAAPLVTTTQYYLTRTLAYCLANNCTVGFAPPNSRLVTIATPPTGGPVWSYGDDQGKSTGTLSYAFDGGFIETTTAYNRLGQVKQLAKPFHLATVADQVSPSYTTTLYDNFNRVWTVSDPLGVIDSTGTARALTAVTTYSGSSIRTDRTVRGHKETRIETRNAIGKPESVEADGDDVPLTVMAYGYDGDGNLTVTQDIAGNQVILGYDTRGRQNLTADADMGISNLTSDGFGDLVSQVHGNDAPITMIYDRAGRLQTKTTSEGTAQWVYDTAPGAGIGKLALMVSAPDPKLNGSCTVPSGLTASTGQVAVKSFQYNALGEVQEVDECAGGSAFATTYQYDALGRQSLIRYPKVNTSQLAVGYHYTSLGYLQYLTDESADYGVLWQAKAMNAFGQVTDEQMRNGVETVSTRNPVSGWLMGSTATAHGNNEAVLQKWGYGYDEMGDLGTRTRADAINSTTSTETFTYDLSNRLIGSIINTSGGYASSGSYGYDLLGNLTQKNGKAYTYGTGCAGPHAVCSVGGGSPFGYDGSGNLTTYGSRSISYNASNKVTQVQSTASASDGTASGQVDFMYGADGNRVVQVVTTGSVASRTVYVGLGGTGKSLYERTTSTGSPTKHVHFIYAGGVHGGSAFALKVLDDTGAVTESRYNSFDRLGSVTAVSDERGRDATSGTDALALGYDDWGAGRNSDGRAVTNPAALAIPIGSREFTGQEQIPDVGLVNMNGRLYDPTLGRFLSPDPNVQDARDSESYNRYSYVRNNPYRYNDPTGYDWDDSVFSGVRTFAGAVLDTVDYLKLNHPMTFLSCAGSTLGCVSNALTTYVFGSTVATFTGAGYDHTVFSQGLNFGVGIFSRSGLKRIERLTKDYLAINPMTAIPWAISDFDSWKSPAEEGAVVYGAMALTISAGGLPAPWLITADTAIGFGEGFGMTKLAGGNNKAAVIAGLKGAAVSGGTAYLLAQGETLAQAGIERNAADGDYPAQEVVEHQSAAESAQMHPLPEDWEAPAVGPNHPEDFINKTGAYSDNLEGLSRNVPFFNHGGQIQDAIDFAPVTAGDWVAWGSYLGIAQFGINIPGVLAWTGVSSLFVTAAIQVPVAP